MRVSSFSLLFFSFMLYLYYGAAVLNGLLSPSPSSINTEKQILDSNMIIGLLDVPYMKELSSDESFIGPQTELTIRLLKKVRKQKRMFFSFAEGFELVRKGHFVFIADTMALIPRLGKELSNSQVCSASIINKISPFAVGLNLRRQSPYKQVWSKSLIWMREVGLVRRSLNYWEPSKPGCVWHQEALSIGVQATSIALSLSFLGILLASLILLLEIRLIKRNNSSKTRQPDTKSDGLL